MNSIVQALIHTPVLREYFLADKHMCQITKITDEQCLVCELSRIFQEVSSHLSISVCLVFYSAFNNISVISLCVAGKLSVLLFQCMITIIKCLVSKGILSFINNFFF